jgi:hypothetical protein
VSEVGSTKHSIHFIHIHNGGVTGKVEGEKKQNGYGGFNLGSSL